jgi:hypothetical protein
VRTGESGAMYRVDSVDVRRGFGLQAQHDGHR